MFLYADSIKTINYCSNVITAWRRKLNHNNVDTSFVKLDQVLIILWHLKSEKYPFPLLQYIVLTILIGSILWWMIWTTYHLMCWSSYVIQFFWFPNVWKWTDGHRYTSFTYLNRPIWIDIIMNPHSYIKHTIRQQRWFTVNFTILKEQELFFIWHIYEKANIFKLHICCYKNNHLFISAHW